MNLDLMRRELACISDIPQHKLGDAEFLRGQLAIGRSGFRDALETVHKLNSKLEEAERLLAALWRYGTLHPVEGVIYPEGSHKQTLKAANEYLLKRAVEKERANG